MWGCLVALMGLFFLVHWYRERQVVSQLTDKYVFITGCDSGFGNLLARQLDMRGLRVLAACLTEKGAEQLRQQTSDRVETVILDVTQTESITAAAQWVKEHVGDRGTTWHLLTHASSLCVLEFSLVCLCQMPQGFSGLEVMLAFFPLPSCQPVLLLFPVPTHPLGPRVFYPDENWPNSVSLYSGPAF